MGFFQGKTLCFTIEVPELEVKAKRNEGEFRWLRESLQREFPCVPPPPLMRLPEKSYDSGTLSLYRKYYERFLNECVKHPDLRHSIALEAFLTSQSKESFTHRQREFARYCQKHVLLEPNFTKKQLEGLTSDLFLAYPSASGQAILKISQILKQHFHSSDMQYEAYEQVFDKLSTLSIEYDKAYRRLAQVNGKLKDGMIELQQIAIRHNGLKLVKCKAALMEDTAFGAISSFLDNNGELSRQDHTGHEGDPRGGGGEVLPVHEGVHPQREGQHRAAQLRVQRVLQA